MNRIIETDRFSNADLNICWVIALHAEARPIIATFDMKIISNNLLFPVYINSKNGHALVVSGIGSIRSAAAATYLKTFLKINEYAAWINVGIAGYFKEPTGEFFQILKVLNQDTGEAFFPGLRLSKFVAASSLLTVGKPEVNFSDDTLYDMEAAGFCETVPLFSCNELTYVFKVVSDTPGKNKSLLTKTVITELIEKNIVKLSKLVGAIGVLVEDEKERLSIPRELVTITENCHFTESNTHKLRQVYRKWKLVFPHRSLNDVNYPLTSAKALIARFESELLDEVNNWKLM
tara:strand:+ start:341 stop:1210 length:870 start_codon:yes stop_codon:yes gene_type:complete